MMELFYLDYGGNVANQMQTYFSILSVLAYSKVPPHIAVVTDHGEAYQRFSSFVETIEIDQQMLQKWRGERDYSFRIKIKAIQHAVAYLGKKEDAPDAFMYIDCDTFATRDLTPLIQDVEAGAAYMHKNEGMPYLTHGPSKRLWDAVKGKSYCGIQIDETAEMWNSGLIAMPASKAADICELTLRLCDEMLADGVRSFNVEQFCFMLAMRQYCQSIHSAESDFCHYWGNKEGWNRLQADFFVKSYMEQHSLEQDVQLMREMNPSSVPYYMKSPIWRKRFLRWVDCIAPLKNIQYWERTSPK